MALRLERYAWIALALYVVLIGGGAYASQVFALRMLTHALFTAVALIWLGLRLRSGRGLPHTPLTFPLMALGGAWLLSSALGPDPRLAFERTWPLLNAVLLYWMMAARIQAGRGRVILEGWLLAATAVLMIEMVELGAWYAGWAAVRPLPLVMPPRLAWALNSSNWLAGFAAPMAVLCIGWALTKLRGERLALLFLGSGLAVVVLLTRVRGGLLALAAAVLVWLLLQALNRRKLSPRLLLAGLILVGVIGAGVLLISGERGRNTGDAGRLDLFSSALTVAREWPILGVGPGVYGRQLRLTRDPRVTPDRIGAAHNGYLGIAAEGGLLTLILSAWLAVVAGRFALRRWNAVDNRERLRMMAVLAALGGFAAHNMVDIFQQLSVMSVLALLMALLTAEPDAIALPGSPAQPAPSRPMRMAPAVMMLLFVAYGAWFLGWVDPAQAAWLQSQEADDTQALALLSDAARRDPGLSLYPLARAYRLAQISEHNRADDGNRQVAEQAMQDAVTLEPSWDVGWLWLAHFRALEGDRASALLAASNAYAINPYSAAAYALVSLAESTPAFSDAELAQRWRDALEGIRHTQDWLPLDLNFSRTPAARAALMSYAAGLNSADAFRIARVHEMPYALPDAPVSAADFWVEGERTLTEGDAQTALESFSAAIARAPAVGDYYAARARAYAELGERDAALADLDLALLLGARDERPYLLLAALNSDDLSAQKAALTRAVPGRRIDQGFSGVLYDGRAADFEAPEGLRWPGPGAEAMRPWYLLAEIFQQEGNQEAAIRVYRAIIATAPSETRARETLNHLDP